MKGAGGMFLALIVVLAVGWGLVKGMQSVVDDTDLPAETVTIEGEDGTHYVCQGVVYGAKSHLLGCEKLPSVTNLTEVETADGRTLWCYDNHDEYETMTCRVANEQE